jgi:hypothetical protein
MELFRALAVLAELPGAEQVEIGTLLELPEYPTREQHAELFDLQLWPYASVYLGTEGMLGGDARDRIAGFWRALHWSPPAEPDHLATLLGLYASLCDLEVAEPDPARQVLWREARRALLWEHMLSWMMPYLSKVEEVASPFYCGWAAMLRAALLTEADALSAYEYAPQHLRTMVGLPDPEVDGARCFIQGILAPARSGMIIVRADLLRAARELGTSPRVGERRFVLETMMSQDAAGMLSWLATEARGWAVRHEAWGGRLGQVGITWNRRAGRAASLLDRLCRAGIDSRDASVDAHDGAAPFH